ncbi:hypothetical protein Tco_0785798 [Tanacetum coccineum]
MSTTNSHFLASTYQGGGSGDGLESHLTCRLVCTELLDIAHIDSDSVLARVAAVQQDILLACHNFCFKSGDSHDELV